MVGKTLNMEAVSRILNHPRVYSFICDDSSLSKYIPEEKDFYIMNSKQTGVVKVDRLNGISCVVHIATLPELWGTAKEFAKQSIKWGFENTIYSKIIAVIPEFNRLTVNLCISCGFIHEGTISKSFMKNWKYYDQFIYGLTKEDFQKRR